MINDTETDEIFRSKFILSAEHIKTELKKIIIKTNDRIFLIYVIKSSLKKDCPFENPDSRKKINMFWLNQR